MYNIRGMDSETAFDTLQNVKHNGKPLPFRDFLVIWQSRPESILLDQKIRDFFGDKQVRNVMEVGSFVGGTLALLSNHINIDDGLAIAIEPELHTTFLRSIVQEAIKPIKLVHIPLFSEDEIAICIVKQLVLYHGLIDIYQIDGAHSKPGAFRDFTNYFDFVNTPGIVIFHDLNEGGIREVFEECSVGKKSDVIDQSGEKTLYGLGIIYKE